MALAGGKPRKALRGGIPKSILTDFSGNVGESRQMLIKTSHWLQERTSDTPTKGLSWGQYVPCFFRGFGGESSLARFQGGAAVPPAVAPPVAPPIAPPVAPPVALPDASAFESRKALCASAPLTKLAAG